MHLVGRVLGVALAIAVTVGGGAVVTASAVPATTSAPAAERSQRPFVPKGTPVAGGPALISATALEPGTFTDAILDGETLWFSVEAVEGQDLTARVTLKTAGAPREVQIALEWSDENARRVDVTRVAGLPTAQATTFAVSTGVVNGSRSVHGAVRDPGTYFLSMRTSGMPARTAHPFVLEVMDAGDGGPAAPPPTGTATSPTTSTATGTATATPTTAQPTTAAATPSPVPPTSTPAPTAASALPPPPSGDGAPTAMFLLLAGVAALGAAVALWWRRRRSAADGPPPPDYY